MMGNVLGSLSTLPSEGEHIAQSHFFPARLTGPGDIPAIIVTPAPQQTEDIPDYNILLAPDDIQRRPRCEPSAKVRWSESKGKWVYTEGVLPRPTSKKYAKYIRSINIDPQKRLDKVQRRKDHRKRQRSIIRERARLAAMLPANLRPFFTRRFPERTRVKIQDYLQARDERLVIAGARIDRAKTSVERNTALKLNDSLEQLQACEHEKVQRSRQSMVESGAWLKLVKACEDAEEAARKGEQDNVSEECVVSAAALRQRNDACDCDNGFGAP